jgi:predicted negative regulator of RcsB-dependent stress response
MHLQSEFQLDEAVTFLDSALAKFPKDKMLQCNKARILAEMGKNSDALTLLNLVLKDDASFGIGHTLKGQVLENLGKKKEARASYEKAIKLDPKDVVAKDKLSKIK